MAKADWTYEVPPAGSDAVGLEDYTVEAADGDDVGKVWSLLRRGSDTFVVVQRGLPVAARDLRAVPWDDVAGVDHEALTVRLRMPAASVESALELDEGKAVEGGEAEAHRVTELPTELAPATSPAAPGPVDRPTYTLALFCGLLGVFSALGLAVFASTSSFTWEFALFAIPAVLLALAGYFGFRFFFRRSSERV